MAILIVIVLVAGAWVSFDIWWLQQPPFEQTPAPLDINTATVSELTALPGIDQSTAEKLITERPYNRTDDLVGKNIIPQATYDKIKGQIAAKQE
jgi:radical SAM superfamily enzyme with C-terminal helix-hairpin-helix motif